MKILVAALFAVCLLPPMVTAQTQKIRWTTDVEAAMELAEQENKLVLLHFSAEWCRPCKHLETFVFSSSIVGKEVHQRLIPVHIDTDSNPDLLKKYAVKEIPTDVVLTAKGTVVSKRKSPNDTNNYVRMVRSLPTSETALNQQNTELSQKVARVLNASSGSKLETGGDFTPAKPSASIPKLTKDLASLKSKSELVNRQVDHQSESKPTTTSNASSPQANAYNGPKRVINESFFNEKSINAKLKSEDKFELQRESEVPPAKILEPDFSKTKPSGDGSKIRANIEFNPSNARSSNPNNNQPNSKLVETAQQPPVNEKEDLNRFIAGLKAEPVLSQSTATIKTNLLQPKMVEETTEEENSQSKTVKEATNLQAGNKLKDSVTPLDRSELVLEGKCPVTLITDGKWAAGDAKYGCHHRGRTFLFADEERFKQFRSDPEKYSPVLVGYDPVVFHEEGRLATGNSNFGVFMGQEGGQKIVLFESLETKEKFQANPQEFMKTVQMAIRQSDSQMK